VISWLHRASIIKVLKKVMY